MSKEAYADSLDHWAKCFRDGTLDDSFANEIAYLLEDKAHDLRIDWQCDRGICEYSDRINGQCQCYNEET